MILPDHEIESLCRSSVPIPVRYREIDQPLISPFLEDQLQPASYDVRLGSTIRIPRRYSYVDLGSPVEDRTDEIDIDADLGGGEMSGFMLMPGRFVLGSTVERVIVPYNVVGRVEGKSTRARQGLQIHAAGYLDPGFRGNVTLELVNLGEDPIILRPNVLIAQFSFEWLASPARRPYGHEHNHYQDSTGVIGARGDATAVADG